jgi:hypothetical protein
LRELGFIVSKEESSKAFSQIVPPSPAGEIEHVLLDWLRQGAEIKRIDWEALYVEAARRAAVYRATLGAKQ